MQRNIEAVNVDVHAFETVFPDSALDLLERMETLDPLERIDAADPANPKVFPEVNIPGFFVDASPGGEIIYSQETLYTDWSQPEQSFLYALALIDDKAYLQSSVELKGSVNSVLVRGGAAFASTHWWEYRIEDRGAARRRVRRGCREAHGGEDRTDRQRRLVPVHRTDPQRAQYQPGQPSRLAPAQ